MARGLRFLVTSAANMHNLESATDSNPQIQQIPTRVNDSVARRSIPGLLLRVVLIGFIAAVWQRQPKVFGQVCANAWPTRRG